MRRRTIRAFALLVGLFCFAPTMLRATMIAIITASLASAAVCRADIILGYSAVGGLGQPGARRYRESDAGLVWSHPTFGETLSGIALGPDGNEYNVLNSLGGASMQRFNSATGAFMNNVVTDGNTTGWQMPSSLVFIGANAYSTSEAFSQNGITGVVRINPTTGAVAALPITTGNNLLGTPNQVFAAPNNTLLVSDSKRINRYNATTGAFISTFIAGTGANRFGHSTFGPDGNFYTCDFADHVVSRYDGTSGTFLGNVITGQPINSVTFGNDAAMYALVGHGAGIPLTIDRYNTSDGAFLNTFVTITSDPFLRTPNYLINAPNTPEPTSAAAAGIVVLAIVARRTRKACH